jgi:hypothetical protein
MKLLFTPCNFLQLRVTSILLGLNILIILLSDTLNPCSFLNARDQPIESNGNNCSLEYINFNVHREQSTLILNLNMLLSDWETLFINITNVLRYVEF